MAERIGRIRELALDAPGDRLASRFPAQHAAFRRARRAEVGGRSRIDADELRVR
jgi:hypothetical protein